MYRGRKCYFLQLFSSLTLGRDRVTGFYVIISTSAILNLKNSYSISPAIYILKYLQDIIPEASALPIAATTATLASLLAKSWHFPRHGTATQLISTATPWCWSLQLYCLYISSISPIFPQYSESCWDPGLGGGNLP